MSAETVSTETTKDVNDIKPIKWDLDRQRDLLDTPEVYGSSPGFAGLTEDTYPLLLKETNKKFILVEGQTRPQISGREEQMLVGTGQMVCPLCNDTKLVFLLHRGSQTGVPVELSKTCFCEVYRNYYGQWMNVKNVGKIFRDCTYTKFLADGLRGRFGISEGFYNTLKTLVLTHSSFCMLMTGDAGCGKTTLMHVLYEKALRAWVNKVSLGYGDTKAIWKVGALQLSNEFREYAAPRVDDQVVALPTVTGSMVLAAVNRGFHPHVSIDELDKYSTTDFQNNNFRDVIDACQSNEGQMVCNANKSLSKLTGTVGEAILRRIIGPTKGVYIDFGEEKLYINYVRHIDGQDEHGKPRLVATDETLRFGPAAKRAKQKQATGPAPAVTTEAAPVAGTLQPRPESPVVLVKPAAHSKVTGRGKSTRGVGESD